MRLQSIWSEIISTNHFFSTEACMWHVHIVWLLGNKSRDKLASNYIIRLLIDSITILQSYNSILIMVLEITRGGGAFFQRAQLLSIGVSYFSADRGERLFFRRIFWDYAPIFRRNSVNARFVENNNFTIVLLWTNLTEASSVWSPNTDYILNLELRWMYQSINKSIHQPISIGKYVTEIIECAPPYYPIVKSFCK